MGDFVVDDERDFRRLLTCAREIVLPGASGIRVPQQRAERAWFDVSNDCVVFTDGMAAYGC